MLITLRSISDLLWWGGRSAAIKVIPDSRQSSEGRLHDNDWYDYTNDVDVHSGRRFDPNVKLIINIDL